MSGNTKLEAPGGKGKCSVCKTNASLTCTGCHSTSYCSVEHQKKDWKTHKLSCVFFIVKNDSAEFTGAGKYCVASRDLKAGTVILEELPLFQMPAGEVHENCITCGLQLPLVRARNSSHSCSKCNWPVCGTDCSKAPIHAANECQVFVANKIPYPKIREGSSMTEICVYPLLMRSYAVMIQKPELWKYLMEMLEWANGGLGDSKNPNPLLDSPAMRNMLWDVVRFQKTNKDEPETRFPQVCDNDDQILLGVLRKIMRLCATQGYTIYLGAAMEQQEDIKRPNKAFDLPVRTATYIYNRARHFVHSCSPNCEWTVGTFPDFKMRIRTAVPVTKGEKLTVSRFIYNLYFSNGTLTRQNIFRRSFATPCRCKLCLDPTEFGTYQSAVVCSSCNEEGEHDVNSGVLLPIDPLNTDENAPWKCNKCGKISIASAFISKIREIVDQVEKAYADEHEYRKKISSEDFCKSVIKKYSNKLLHPNHWALQFAMKLIRQSQVLRFQHMKGDDFLEFEKLLLFLLKCKDKTVPGILNERIIIVYFLSVSMTHRLMCSLETLNAMSSEELWTLQENVQKCYMYQKEAFVFYKQPTSVGRGKPDDYMSCTLSYDMNCVQGFLSAIHDRLVEIAIQRLRLGVN